MTKVIAARWAAVRMTFCCRTRATPETQSIDPQRTVNSHRERCDEGLQVTAEALDQQLNPKQPTLGDDVFLAKLDLRLAYNRTIALFDQRAESFGKGLPAERLAEIIL